ncbi:PaaI family thioesterase [Aliikangiella sp. G2MR2-5]|uniref:PaaI family thioesterase n=1 Tax=Aliikangiella sp. G2MR2-5 TaxID=2788943 RepID=UPI0018A8913C|nr:hotdog fold thioesterase [Aliikangiella sp. G2MR2-5]
MNRVEQLLNNDPASQMLGITLEKCTKDECRLVMLVTDAMTNGYDFCHGGFVYSLADTASAFAAAVEGETILTASHLIEYLAPAKNGDRLTAEAKVSINSGRNRFCDVKVCDQNNQLIAVSRSKLISKRIANSE